MERSVPVIKRGGWNTGLRLREIIIVNVSRGFKVTRQAAAQSEIVCRSVLRSWSDWRGQSTTIYKRVSSANKRFEHPMCLTLSLVIYIANKKNRIEKKIILIEQFNRYVFCNAYTT